MLSGVPSHQISSALLISKHGHISQSFYDNEAENKNVVCVESDHPIPKSASIEAGNTLLEYIKNIPEKAPILLLISGGTSALVEVLQEGWDLPQLQSLTDYLLANAYSIDEINAVRRRVSRIKGGGLWDYLGGRSVACLMISDVPDDDPAVIGSGLLFPSKYNELPKLPQEWLQKLEKYKPHKAPSGLDWEIVASLKDAKIAAANKAQSLGYQTDVIPDFLGGDAEKTAKSCVKILQENKNTVCIWGGETTVTLPKKPGKGGRNQHMALAAAIEMAINDADDIHLLAAGTDGSDGVTTATGAIVDGLTVQRGNQQHMNAKNFLARADSNRFFEETDKETKCLISTGATGTNVMDLVIGISL